MTILQKLADLERRIETLEDNRPAPRMTRLELIRAIAVAEKRGDKREKQRLEKLITNQ